MSDTLERARGGCEGLGEEWHRLGSCGIGWGELGVEGRGDQGVGRSGQLGRRDCVPDVR